MSVGLWFFIDSSNARNKQYVPLLIDSHKHSKHRLYLENRSTDEAHLLHLPQLPSSVEGHCITNREKKPTIDDDPFRRT